MQQETANIGRHAYLILCHNNFKQLCLLLDLLDDKRNDIYIHVDKKTNNVPFDMIKAATKHSGVYFVDRINVTWGGFSLVRAELNLIKAAAKGGYDYCHLMSGVDLPLKSQNEIHAFFDRLNGKECISFERIDNVLERVRYYYPLQDVVGRTQSLTANFFRKVQDLIVRVQRKLKISRIRGREVMFHEGANWVSFTGNFAKYIVKKTPFIRRNFRFTFIPDELYIQTLVMNSPFKDRLHTTTVRLIDWERGRPYTFTNSDYDELTSSDKLFARKFDYKKDIEIIHRIHNHVKNS